MAKKSNSRPARWADACARARAAADELEAAVSDLRDLQSEYEEWRDNLPENLQSSALSEKLNEVCDLQLDDLVDTSVIDDAEGIDLPRGFGKD